MPARRIDTNTSFLPSITLACHRLQRRLDLDVLHRHVARDLVGHEQPSLVQQAAEAVGAASPCWRISVSLCWTSGWSMRWTLSLCHGVSMLSSEDRAVAGDAQRRQRRRAGAARARGRRPRCRLRARGPAAGARRRAAARCAPRRATSSSSATVSARHSTMSSSPGCQSCARRGFVAQAQHAAVDQQAAVAVLGQARSAASTPRTFTPAHSKGSSSE